MNIKDMSAEQRKEELARLADAVKAAKAETKTAKTRVAEGKDAVKGAKTAEEKAALKESLAARGQSHRGCREGRSGSGPQGSRGGCRRAGP